MEFTLFKPSIKKTNIITTLVSLIIGLIMVIILYAINSDTDHYKIPFTILFIINCLFVPFILWLLHRIKVFISFTYLIVSYKFEDTTKDKTSFKVNLWIHLAIFIFFTIIYFIELTVTMEAYSNNWLEAAKNNWWIVFIMFIVNITITEFCIYFNNYQFNHDHYLLKEIKK